MDPLQNQNPIPPEPTNLPPQPSLPQAQEPAQTSSLPQAPNLNQNQQPVSNLVYPHTPQVFQPQVNPQQSAAPMNPNDYMAQPSQVVVGDGGMVMDTPPRKSKSMKLLLPIVVLAILILGGGSYYFLTKASPMSVFNKTLSDALSTSQVEQIITGGGSSGDIKFNLANIQNPIVSSSISLGIFGLTYNFNAYGTRNNTFVDYTSLDASGVTENTSTITPFLNKWVQVRDNGNLPSGGDDGLDNFIDPRSLLFGQYIFGNFTSSERSTLLAYIESNNIYEFNSKNVTNGTLNGSKVLIYPVSLNLAKLTTFNDKVANMLNFSSSDVQSINQSISSGPKSATLYIDPSSDRLLKVTSTSEGTTSTVTYSNYNDLTLPQQPAPQLTYAQYTALQNQAVSSD